MRATRRVQRVGADALLVDRHADEPHPRRGGGALQPRVRQLLHEDRLTGACHRGEQEREPAITVARNGPYRITGGIDLLDEPWGEGASTEHYVLCRCGGSKNKPFCDGSHWNVKFRDPRN